MSNKILATYVNGVFRPIEGESLELPEGQNVVLDVEPIDRATYILSLAHKVFEGLTEEEIAEIEQVMKRRMRFSAPDEQVEEPAQEQIM